MGKNSFKKRWMKEMTEEAGGTLYMQDQQLKFCVSKIKARYYKI